MFCFSPEFRSLVLFGFGHLGLLGDPNFSAKAKKKNNKKKEIRQELTEHVQNSGVSLEKTARIFPIFLHAGKGIIDAIASRPPTVVSVYVLSDTRRVSCLGRFLCELRANTRGRLCVHLSRSFALCK